MSSLFSCSSKQLQGTQGTGREGAEHPGSLSYIFTCSRLQQRAASQPALAERRQMLPIRFVLDGFLGVGLHFFFKEVFIFWQFSICFIYKQNLCWRSLTPTDLLGFFARGRINPESGDWWDFLFPYLPLIQRAHSPCSLLSLQALFAKCCSLWYVF